MRMYFVLMFLTLPSSILSAEEATVLGGIQFWARTCSNAESCELPAAIGPVHVVRGSITAPTQPNEVGHFKQTIDESDLRVVYHVFWKKPVDQKPHFVFQQKLLKRVDHQFVALAECSSYTTDQLRPAFHVGACTGFVASSEGQIQHGVSFIKAQ